MVAKTMDASIDAPSSRIVPLHIPVNAEHRQRPYKRKGVNA